jgi:hypothetical protein
LNAIWLVLIVSAVLITIYPTFYFIGWLLSIPPLYLGLFRKSAGIASNSSNRDLATDFHRHKGESREEYLFRRIVTFIGWNLATILVYWIIILFTIGSVFEEDNIAGHIAKGLLR